MPEEDGKMIGYHLLRLNRQIENTDQFEIPYNVVASFIPRVGDTIFCGKQVPTYWKIEAVYYTLPYYQGDVIDVHVKPTCSPPW
jgi:hypothetical protein